MRPLLFAIIPNKDLSAMVVLLGWIVAPIQNLIANIWYGLVLVSKSTIRLPLWIAVTNMVLLIIQFIVFIILP
ncbi:MAG: hypothetical protein B7Z27_04480 [Sphingobacteriia bacterium 32-37-4]|nr:MAG: hypothetical protein B7Z27_04480 [Sphingobacteriia bacterium 32-37-4]